MKKEKNSFFKISDLPTGEYQILIGERGSGKSHKEGSKMTSKENYLIIAIYDGGVGFSVATPQYNIDLRDFWGNNRDLLEKFDIDYKRDLNYYSMTNWQIATYFIKKLNISPDLVIIVEDSDINIFNKSWWLNERFD